MISYFKYTDGSSFTLNGLDYKGMFNNTGGEVFTGTMRSSSSKILSSKGGFLNRIYDYEVDFDFTFENIVSMDVPLLFPRSILTIDNLTDVLNRLDQNNITLLSKMVTYDSNLLNVFTKSSDNVSTVFCLTSIGDSLSGKKLPLTRISVASGSDYALLRNDILKSNLRSTFFVTSPNNTFKYYSSNYMLSGSLSSTDVQPITALRVINNLSAAYVDYNRYQNIAYSTVLGSNVYDLYYLDTSTSCNTSVFFDAVDVSAFNTSSTTPGLFSYGKNYRTALTFDQGTQVVEISKVNTADQLILLTPSDVNMDSILSVCQRFEDDILAVYGLLQGIPTLNIFDIESLLGGSFSTKYSNDVYDISSSERLHFAPFDSNILIFTRHDQDNTISNIEFRSISNPTYPLVRISGFDNLGFLQPNIETIDQVDINVETLRISLGVDDSSQHRIYDIQFDVTDKLNIIVFYESSYEIYSTAAIFKSLIPFDTTAYFTPTYVLGNGSVGIIFNDIIKSILKDTLTLCNIAKVRFSTNNYNIINDISSTSLSTLLGDEIIKLNRLSDINLRINENESFNVGVLNRIIAGISTIQTNIASSFNSVT